MSLLTEYTELPEGLLDLEANELADLLPGPSLIHLEGKRTPALFVSILLHGNETVGWEAVRRLLKHYRPGGGERELPRSMTVFIGNVEAARNGLRKLDGRPDFNRTWPGGENGSPEAGMMRQVVDIMTRRGIFASVDVHNNTGINPHYACINVLDARFLRLAALFSRLVIYFIRPRGVQSMAFAQICPAVTLECGRVGDEAGVQHAVEYVDACLHMSELSDQPLGHTEVDLFHTVATVKLTEGVDFGFGDIGDEFRLDTDLERFNFSELPPETHWGDVSSDELPLRVTDENGIDVTSRYFKECEGRLCNRLSVMPSMLTTDTRVIEQDCLCYLMERYKLPEELLHQEPVQHAADA